MRVSCQLRQGREANQYSDAEPDESKSNLRATTIVWADRPGWSSSFVQSQVSSVLMVVVDEFRQKLIQATFAADDHVIGQIFSASVSLSLRLVLPC
jgi:hypothetical protein